MGSLGRPWSAPLRSAGIAVAALAVAVAGVLVLDGGRKPGGAGVATNHEIRGRVSPSLVERAPVVEVTRLLDTRAAALLRRDRSAFLATVDQGSATFHRSQAALFDALAAVPLGSWSYELGTDGAPRSLSAVQQRRYGDPTYVPDVVRLSYRFRGFDAGPTTLPLYLTFVHRAAGWLLASDDDVDGKATARELWDYGPVRVLAGRRSLLLGHRAAALPALAAAVDRAVPAVSAVWGTGWNQHVVVVVPDTSAELSRLVNEDRDVSKLAAIATAWSSSATAGTTVTGQRVLLNPANFARLGAVGRQVVLTHEITHVATRTATGATTPVWLSEGFADYVAYRAAGAPVRAAAVEPAADVRAGRLPARLPAAGEFDASAPRLAQAYEEAWLACRLIAETSGPAALVRFYRAAAGPGDRAAVLGSAFGRVLGTTEAAFTARWRGYLRTRLS